MIKLYPEQSTHYPITRRKKSNLENNVPFHPTPSLHKKNQKVGLFSADRSGRGSYFTGATLIPIILIKNHRKNKIK